MCSTDENKKESADLVEYEIYEGDKDFEKNSVSSDIDEHTDDGSSEDPSGDQPKLIQCTPKVGSFYQDVASLVDQYPLHKILSQRCNPWEHYESECQHDQEECQSDYPHCNDHSGTENAYCQHYQIQEGGEEIFRCESCAGKTIPADCIYDFGSKVYINIKL